MATKQAIHQAFLDQWASLIKDQQASGMTVKDWCYLNNISRHKYNYWKHRLKEEFIQSIPQEIVPLDFSELSSDTTHTPFTAPNTTGSSSFIRITINDTLIEIPTTSASPEIISGIIKAVRYA